VSASSTSKKIYTWKMDARAAAGIMFILTLLSLVGWLYLTEASYVAATGYHLEAMRAERDRLRRENAQLAYEVAQLSTQDQVEKRARQLGFAPISEAHYLAVTDYPAAGPKIAQNTTVSSSQVTVEGEDWWDSLVARFIAWLESPTVPLQARAQGEN
jgi:cell division protein FtsB